MSDCTDGSWFDFGDEVLATAEDVAAHLKALVGASGTAPEEVVVFENAAYVVRMALKALPKTEVPIEYERSQLEYMAALAVSIASRRYRMSFRGKPDALDVAPLVDYCFKCVSESIDFVEQARMQMSSALR